ncbi:hypothetical protein [Mycobacterium sp.]|uniref:hypothetical protein n=1 Tax=Mycobacterium sp. TaxID=1785 RepID=UPI003F98B741
MIFPTVSGVGIRIATSGRRRRGSVIASVGSEPITLSRRAPRNTDRTLLNRVVIVPGASPATVIVLTHASMCERRMARISRSANGTEPAASPIALTVVGAHTWRAAHCR